MEMKAALCAAVLEVLNEDNYVDWSVRVKTYLMAHDLWDIVEATGEPLKQEDDEAAFKAWSKKNSMALHVIQISCGPNEFSEIRNISSAKIAWDTLAEKYLSETKSDVGDDGKHNYVEYADLYKAVVNGDWYAAKEFLKRRPDAVSAKITQDGLTALHVAVAAGHMDIAEELVKLMSEENLEIVDNDGYTALNEAVMRGKYRLAEFMLSKNKKLISIGQDIPVVKAIYNGHIEMARYLYSLTPTEDLMPENGPQGANLFTEAIYMGTLDIALDLIRHCPRLALTVDTDGISPLLALASTPQAFPSGNQLRFWKRWIYSCIRIQSAGATNETRLNIPKVEMRRSDQVKRLGLLVPALLRHLVSNVLNYLGIDHLYEMKLTHVQSRQLLCRMCEEIPNSNNQQREDGCVYGAIVRAIKNGIFEVVFEILRTDPELLWSDDGESRNIFSLAVLNRQPKIFSLMYGLDLKNALACCKDDNHNGMLHMAGMSAESTTLNRIPGAALQMQRELQWFKEVESIVHPKVKDAINDDSLSPQELFTKNHKEMRKEGEQWMKDTATSCTVVGALIVTIMFAAVFTVPGGNNQNTGLPMFLNEKLFMLFIISDALSLFSSATSVLMFMGILTSRYAEDDFLKSLPTKMIIGLSTLFFSIATLMIAFSAALLIMLRGQSWIFIPVICLASVPVTLFVMMQFPLLVDMTISTYGSGIFDRKMKPLF